MNLFLQILDGTIHPNQTAALLFAWGIEILAVAAIAWKALTKARKSAGKRDQ